MKKVFIALWFLPSLLFSQEYSEVIEVPGKTADQLYTSARMWFAESFQSANHVLQMDDQKAGIIIGKGNMSISDYYDISPGMKMSNDWIIDFTVKIMVKDARYKCDIYEFLVTPVINGDISSKAPLSTLLENREFYKNGSDPEWLKKNYPKLSAKSTSKVNQSYYNNIIKFENNIPVLFESVKKSMRSDDDW